MSTLNHQSLRVQVAKAMEAYFKHLDGHEPVDLYDMVMAEVEKPFLQAVMEYVDWNQCRAAKILGLNRGTLRTKLKKYAVKKSKTS